jgi:hypothetical protein
MGFDLEATRTRPGASLSCPTSRVSGDIHQTVFVIKDRLLIILWRLGGMKRAM